MILFPSVSTPAHRIRLMTTQSITRHQESNRFARRYVRAFAVDVAVGNGETSGVCKPHFAAIVVTLVVLGSDLSSSRSA